MERAVALRETMVRQLERGGLVRRAVTAAAMRAVPRHEFLPDLPLGDAYADRAIALKMRDGEIVSSISQPGMIALMLELLAPVPGDRILEIGTGSGYNAALLAELTGPHGAVVTIDLDPDLAQRAQSALEALGYRTVRVVAADGARDVTAGARFDGIIVTARGDDVAAAWWRALGEGARLVVPLRIEGAGEYAVGFVRNGDRLKSIGVHPCAFLALRGEGAAPSSGDVFYRDPAQRNRLTQVRRVESVVAVRKEQATPDLLDAADLVVARPVTMFAVRFA